MNKMITLIRREFWEHRALWITPLVVAGLILVSAFGGPRNIRIEGDPLHGVSGDRGRALFAVLHWALTVPQYLLMMILLFFYLLDCLYGERRDRSILFWKSLPVSDAATVVSKLLVALVVVPFGVFAIALVTDLAFSGIVSAKGGPINDLLVWDTLLWLQVQALMLGGLMVAVLWYAPVAGYLLLVSAWSKRNPFIWAVVPPFVLIVLERIAFGTENFREFLTYRLFGIWRELGFGKGITQMGMETYVRSRDFATAVPEILRAMNAGGVLANASLWIGIVVAGVLVFAAIRVRQQRDDS
jgi:ABC-2 type transport system permease protein